MLAEESEPQPPQGIGAVEHHLHQPAGMGTGVEVQRQLHDVLEIARQHRLALAVCQPVGMQCHRRAASNGEQAERDPCEQQRPGRRRCEHARRWFAGEDIDDAAEQHRFGELRGGQAQVGAGENPAQPRLLAEQFKNAGIEAEQGHALIRPRGGSGSQGVHSNQGSPRRYSA